MKSLFAALAAVFLLSACAPNVLNHLTVGEWTLTVYDAPCKNADILVQATAMGATQEHLNKMYAALVEGKGKKLEACVYKTNKTDDVGLIIDEEGDSGTIVLKNE